MIAAANQQLEIPYVWHNYIGVQYLNRENKKRLHSGFHCKAFKHAGSNEFLS
jgi:hypothetical protein